MTFDYYRKTKGTLMTLVPIIYTSLIIFASFLIFVVFASYIAFRARSGNKINRSMDEMQLGYIPQQALMNHESHRRESVPIQTRVNAQSYISQSNNITLGVSAQKYNDVNIHEIKRTQQKEISRQKKSAKQNLRSNRQTDRIEIMNNSEKFKRTSEFDNFPTQVSGTISDSNLLTYYSDRSDIDFTVMNASYMQKVQ
jgi:hypothetical protein